MLTRRLFLTSAAALPLAPSARADDGPVRLRELYARGGGFSAFTLASEGQRITVQGFMAPPLKSEASFFVLTKMPMSVCPFCETSAEWPDNILAVYTKRVVDVVPFNVGIAVNGVVETGAFSDPETGFVSLLRLRDATYG